MHKWDGPQSFPFVITIFSAPNYCGYYDNKGCIFVLENGKISLKQYEPSETPYRLPNNMDIFKWSMPFMAQKVFSMFTHIIQKCSDLDDSDLDVNKDKMGQAIKDEQKLKRKSIFKKKLSSMVKVNRMFGVLTSER